MRITILLLSLAVLVFSACEKTTTPGGYKFEKHKSGDGAKPKPGDFAFFYIDLLFDDSLVISTRERGEKIPVIVISSDSVKKEKEKDQSNPLAEAAVVMREGDSITLYVPVDEKMKQNPALANVKNLVHRMVLVEVQTKAEYDSTLAAERKIQQERQAALAARVPEVKSLVDEKIKQYGSGALKSTIQTTSTGLKYIILEPGTGTQAAAQQPVQVQYYGVLKDGKMFDNSFERATPYNFKLGVGAVIPGWDEGIALLKEGGKAFLFVPPTLAYGDQGNELIPANSELIFYVELEKVGN